MLSYSCEWGSEEFHSWEGGGAKCWIKVDLECFLFPFVSLFLRILLNEIREELKGGSLWNRLQVGQEGDKEAHSLEPQFSQSDQLYPRSGILAIATHIG